MKCKVCDGRGFFPTSNIAAKICPQCDGTGEVEQTNEEWFCSLSTKEKAKEIYKIAKDDFKELRKLFYGVANDDCDAVAMWLKEKHND